jgi:hypothetical protein
MYQPLFLFLNGSFDLLTEWHGFFTGAHSSLWEGGDIGVLSAISGAFDSISICSHSFIKNIYLISKLGITGAPTTVNATYSHHSTNIDLSLGMVYHILNRDTCQPDFGSGTLTLLIGDSPLSMSIEAAYYTVYHGNDCFVCCFF